MMDVLEKLVGSSTSAPHPQSRTGHARALSRCETIYSRIKDRDKRIGICLDVGHDRRCGADPVESIRKYRDRIYDVHLKNIRVKGIENNPEPGPRGDLDIPGICRALAEIGYDGYCLIEYEKDFENVEAPLLESFAYYRGVMDAVGVKASEGKK